MADDLNDAASAAPPEPAPHGADSQESRLWAILQHWRDAHLADGPIARTTACWNHLQTALSQLASSILKEF